jgi:uncharacterized protein (DUF1015 family)
MATIQPFRGVRFNPHKVPDLSAVISQPYDRVRYGLQDKYYELSLYNIVRVIKGKELDTDLPDRPGGPNVYTRARAYYDLWRVEEVLVREGKPALYAYHQTFAATGRTRTRKGFVAAFKLSTFDEGIVLPHERTHAGPKVDRLRLLRATEVNLGQIFTLYPDPENKVSAILDNAVGEREPDVEAIEMHEEGVRQRLWVITDAAAIRAVQEEMSPKRNLIIADGHHRYETALNYRDEMRAQHPDAPKDVAFNYRMATFVSTDDPGLVILPTHREVHSFPQVTGDDILARAAPTFEVTSVDNLDTCFTRMRAGESQHAFGLYVDGRYHVLLLKNPQVIEQWIADARSLAWKSLDVSIAHKILLGRVIGLPAEAMEAGVNLRYHRDPLLPVENVDAGRANFVLFLNPTRIDQVKDCAERGEKMPQKSTDFYPKMITGLAMMPVDAQERI